MIFGESLLLGSIQVALASTEMSSRYSVLNFSKDQDTLQNAANALSSYILVAIVFAIGAILVMYSSFGIKGLIICLFTNVLIVGWIVFSYLGAFRSAATKYHLKMPKLFQSLW